MSKHDQDPLDDLIGLIRRDGSAPPKIILPPEPLPPLANLQQSFTPVTPPKQQGDPTWLLEAWDAQEKLQKATDEFLAAQNQAVLPALTDDVLRLWFREIKHAYSGGYNAPPGNTLGPWQHATIPITGIGQTLKVMKEPKNIETMVIKLAAERSIGLYPRVLYRFEWLGGSQEIKDGYVRS